MLNNIYRRKLRLIQKTALASGLDIALLKQYDRIYENTLETEAKKRKRKVIAAVLIILSLAFISLYVVNNILVSRCLVPSHYLVWEATRPIADCSYCENITNPIILQNVSRHDFTVRYIFTKGCMQKQCLSLSRVSKVHAYSSGPIIVKKAAVHWKATKEFSYSMFKRLYEQTEGSYESLDEGCQFLNFKTDMFSLKEVFSMSDARARNEPGETPWYVGWGNCHPAILAKVRKYYSIPHFLPEDAEYPATENIFFGYEIGAVMHLDYIQRLMWQAQVQGNKTWSIAPVPECEHICHKFKFYVEPGDILLLDTRIWYHATSIPKGQFSLAIQSEYG